MSYSINNDGQEWELCKENAAPLERGRNVKTLIRALSSTTESEEERKMNERTIRRYERLVRPSERRAERLAVQQSEGVDNVQAVVEVDEEDPDPLVHWLSYIKFYQDTYPSDTQQQFLLMERCTRSLMPVRKYANDVRFIRVCIIYADKTSCPGDIFKFLNKQKIGSVTALFWIAWAWVAEKGGDYAFAEKIFVKGLSKRAKPVKQLEARQKQFRRRMSRHWLNNSKQQDEDGIDQEEADERGSRRGALGSLSTAAVSTNHRSRAANNRAGLSSTFLSRGGDRASSRNANNGVIPSGGLNIYVDDEGDTSEREFEEGGHGQRRGMLVKEKDRTKENTLKAERWNERGGLGQCSQHPSQRQMEDANPTSFRFRGTAAPPPVPQAAPAPLEIFVDDECKTKNEEEDKERDLKDRGRGGDGRSLRQRLDGSTAEKLARDPLRYMRNPSKLEADKQKSKENRTYMEKKQPGRSEKPAVIKGDENQMPCSNQISSKEGEKQRHEQPPQSKSEISKGARGFCKRLVAKDSSGHECCFEEGRAKAKYYALVSPETNFNKLEDTRLTAKRTGALLRDDSAMDFDEEESIDDVDMEDDFPIEHKQDDIANTSSHMKEKQQNEVPLMQKAGQESHNKPPMSRRVLFDENLRETNKLNISTASSTLDERDAVGAPAEETINTKFARLEMSIMFSSPDKEDFDEKPLFSMNGGAQFNSSTENGHDQSVNALIEERGDTATLSIVAELLDDKVQDRASPPAPHNELSNENDENIAPRNPMARNNRTRGFGGCALRTLPQAELDQDEMLPLQQKIALAKSRAVMGKGKTPASFSVLPVQDDVGPAFQIFCDEDEENEENLLAPKGASDPPASSDNNAPFAIFCDEEEHDFAEENKFSSIAPHGASDPPTGGDSGAPFTVFCDEEEIDCAGENTSSSLAPRGTSDLPTGDDSGAPIAIFCDEEEDDSAGQNKSSSPAPQSTSNPPTRGDSGAPFAIFCDENEEDSVAEGEKRQSDGGDTATFSLFGEAMKGMECDANGSKRSKRRASSRGGNSKFSTYSKESGKFEKRKSILKSKPVQVKPKKAEFSIFCDDDTHDDMVRL